MKVIKFDQNMKFSDDTVLVLGYFDGLHRGHKALFDEAKKIATILNLKVAVLTFPEKPTLAFQKFEPDMLLKLTSDKKREELFAKMGVDYLFLQEFTSIFADRTAENFVENYVKKLNPKVVVIGFDYTTGKDMKILHSTEDLKVAIVPEFSENGEKVSSTRIRKLVNEGNMFDANRLLGYEYETQGIVVHGFARGRQLGYPTANQVIKDYIHIPSPGVYTVDAVVHGERLRGFASIGYNDTFGNKEKTIEVHIFDFDGDIYGENITVYWLDKIRDMVKFDGMDSLIAAMKADEQSARNFKNPFDK